MQDKYAGDVTDFFKFFLLKKVQSICNKKIGINWYVPSQNTINRETSNDGRIINWLNNEEIINLDLELSSKLKNVISGERTIAGIEDIVFNKNDFIFFNKPMEADRNYWFNESLKAMNNAEIIFLDPDNGFKEGDFYKKPSEKHALSTEIKQYYNNGQSIILINFRDRSRQDKYDNKLSFIRHLIDTDIPIRAIRNRNHNVKDFVFIPQRNLINEFELVYREMEKYSKFYTIYGINTNYNEFIGYQFTTKGIKIKTNRFSEDEQTDFDNFYTDELSTGALEPYRELISKTVNKVIEIESLKLTEGDVEELEYHIIKAIKLFTFRREFY